MLLYDLSPKQRQHIAIAIRRYVRQLEDQAKTNGTVVPPELGQIAEALYPAPSRVTPPERDGEDSLDRKRRLAAARSKRYRERVRRDGSSRLAS